MITYYAFNSSNLLLLHFTLYLRSSTFSTYDSCNLIVCNYLLYMRFTYFICVNAYIVFFLIIYYIFLSFVYDVVYNEYDRIFLYFSYLYTIIYERGEICRHVNKFFYNIIHILKHK